MEAMILIPSISLSPDSTHEVQHELGSPVTDHLFGESMQLPNAILGHSE